VGFAFGSGLLILGTAAAAIILFSLWPLHAILDRVHRERLEESRVRLAMTRLATLGAVYDVLRGEHVALVNLSTQRLGKGRYEADLRLQLPQRLRLPDIELRLASLDDVEVLETAETAY
jgi:uncharacterized membrane protein YhiD involved in acid resistance